MDKPGLVDWLIAPLTWLERARGPKRLGLLVLYAMTILVVGMLGWRSFSLWGLPDIGEPFDEARYGTVDLSPDANAMSLYRDASDKLIWAKSPKYQVGSSKAWENLGWPTADPEVRRWLEDNRPALVPWLEGTERADSLFVQPRELAGQTPLDPLMALQSFASLARLEASRLESSGDLEGAWKYLRATLRSSRHVGMHGLMMQRAIGMDILVKVTPDVQRWSENPRVTPAMLRRAIADVAECKAMTPPNSAMFRADYFAKRAEIDRTVGYRAYRSQFGMGEQPWYGHFAAAPMIRQFLNREPERSHRVHRLIVAGILAQCDRPGAERPKMVAPRSLIFDHDARTPASVASIKPEDLATWASRSDDGPGVAGNYGFLFSRIEAEASTFDTILLNLAQRAYEIEHGQPPKTYGDLQGGYLKALPQGFAPGDPIVPFTGSN